MANPSEKITVDDCRVGAWVEVSNGGKEPWRGMIAKVDPTSSQPIAVKWVGNATPGLAVKPGVKWPTNTPDGLYTWRGGIHFVEVLHHRTFMRDGDVEAAEAILPQRREIFPE